MAENRVSLQRYAMVCGTFMGVYWIVKFIFLPLGFLNPFFLFLFIAFTLAVPFLAYRWVRVYRDKVCGGTIGFLQAWLFLVFMFLFASLLTAVAHYIYLNFIDNGFLINQFTVFLDSFPRDIPGTETSLELNYAALDQVRKMTPIEITMQLMSSNFLNSSLLSLVIALFVMKKNTSIS